MAEVVVDTEKLAYGLKRGIAETDTIFSAGPEKYRLRYTACGLVSTAIHQYCEKQDIPSSLVISSPNLDIEPGMQHVMPVIGESILGDVIVDASFSQFLGYAGLSWGYEIAAGVTELPTEEIITFKFSERKLISDWLTSLALDFQKRNIHPKDDMGFELGQGPLASADAAKIHSTYDAIWDPANMGPWEPPKRVSDHGKIVESHIPAESIFYS